jgi:putative colanic acid biosynthesis glycosyltransferase
MISISANRSGGSKAPLLSIITVCLNDVVRLKKTTDSLSAFYGDERFEHLVVDGGSMDATRGMVGPLLKKTNFKYHLVSDSGIYDAMNIGILYCQSPLLLFLNCGDTVIGKPDDLSRILQTFVSKNEIYPDISCFPVHQVAGVVVKTLTPKALPQHRMPTSHQGMIFSKQFLLQNQYETSYKIAGDYDVYLRACNVEVFGGGLCEPWVAVEAEGYASRHPFRAYYEYVYAANQRLSGIIKVIALFRICIRALIVVPLKVVLPPRWVAALKGQ